MNALATTDISTLTNRPVHQARTLTGQDGCAMIELDGQLYTLRITRAGKLILTK